MSKNLKGGGAGGRLNQSNARKMRRGGRSGRTSSRQQSRLGYGTPAATYQFPTRVVEGDSVALYGGFFNSIDEWAENTARKFCEERGHEYAYNAAGSVSQASNPATWNPPPDNTIALLHFSEDANSWGGGMWTQDKSTWTTIQCTSPGTPYGGF